MAARVTTAAVSLASVIEVAILLLASATASAQPGDISPSAPSTWTADQLPSPAELEAAGAVIGAIEIENENIFDLRDPEENRALYRFANRMHMRTRANIVREQLLFAPGEPFSQRKLEESERILRGARYLYDAKIRPVAWRNGIVDINVTTRDVWTLNPGVSFGRQGGKSTTGLQLEEVNAMGTGVTLALSHESGVERDSTQVQVKDPHFWDGRTVLDTSYSDTSDGRARWFALDHPFYSLDSRWALGSTVADEKLVHSLYDLGKRRAQFLRESKFARLYGGASEGLLGEWVQRWTFGATFDERSFDAAPGWDGTSLVPDGRKFVYPWIGYELLQDHFHELKNRDQIGRTEDFFLGTRIYARIGWADTALGSTYDALLFNTQAAHGLEPSPRGTLLFAAGLSGRYASGDLENTKLNAGARYYLQQTRKALLFATLDGTVARRVDLDEQAPMLLGGDTGLRGYPLRYQSGTARALLTIEQRYFTDWYPWRLFRIGGAAFFDMGRTWGRSPLGTESLGLLKDVGIGLRIGNTRSGLGNVIHVDVAFPLDGDSSIDRVQLLIQTLERF